MFSQLPTASLHYDWLRDANKVDKFVVRAYTLHWCNRDNSQ